jgi:high-affinity nickel-transport protein
MPPDPFIEYGTRTSFLVGMVHGVGAETPTQVLLFSTAAGVAGTAGGVALLSAFVFGLLLGNTILAFATATGFAAGRKVPYLYMAFAALTALISIYVGATYVLARPDLLPGLLGG